MVTEPRTREAAGAAAASRRVVPDVGAVAPDIWLISAATLVAAVLRFATITSQSFWIDEASTVHEVGLSLGSMLHAVRLNETTPQLYFVIAWVWTRIFGGGELGIRSLSAVAGVALVPVLYLCGRELVSRRAGVAAAALAAFNPFLIWYSQEARSYMLLGLLSGLSLLFCARAIRTRARRDVVAWGACSALAILTHFFAAFLIVPEALWILWQLRSREAVLVAGAVAAIQLAILPLAIADTVRPFPSILAAPLSVRLEQVPVTFAASQLYESSVTWGAPGAAILLAIVGALLWLGADPAERRGARRAAAIAAVTLLMPVAFAAVGHDYVFARNLLPAWIPLAVLLGAACAASRARTAGMAFGVALIALFLWAGAKIDSSPAYQRPDWRGAAVALGSSSRPRAILAYDGNAAEQPLAIYLRHTRFSYSGMPRSNAAVPVSEVDVIGNTAQSIATRLPAGVRVISSSAVNDILVVRFALRSSWRLAPSALAAAAPSLVGPAPAGHTAVIIQR